MRPLIVLVSVSFLGAAAGALWLSGFLPWFLIPDFPFLSIVYAGLFLPPTVGILAAVPAAIIREVTLSAPPYSLFMASLALYFASREIGMRLFIRAESFILLTVVGLLLAETFSIMFLVTASGSRPFTFLWGVEEAVRVAWTGLLAVPLFMDLSDRWRRVRE
jgi:cell shape-determining protein MreD